MHRGRLSIRWRGGVYYELFLHRRPHCSERNGVENPHWRHCNPEAVAQKMKASFSLRSAVDKFVNPRRSSRLANTVRDPMSSGRSRR